MSKIPSVSAEGTPPGDFYAFEDEVWSKHLLGPAPRNRVTSDTPWGRPRELRAEHPERWPKDKTGREYFHRGLVRLLWKRGGTAEAADSIQRALEDGRALAVVVADDDGQAYPIPPDLWMAAAASPEMYWNGRAAVTATSGRRLGQIMGDIYLIATSEPDAAPEPTKGKPADLGARERTTVYRMLLAAVVEAYGYRPNARSDAASQLAAASERLWPDGGVSERTIRDWLKAAVEELGDPTTEKP